MRLEDMLRPNVKLVRMATTRSLEGEGDWPGGSLGELSQLLSAVAVAAGANCAIWLTAEKVLDASPDSVSYDQETMRPRTMSIMAPLYINGSKELVTQAYTLARFGSVICQGEPFSR